MKDEYILKRLVEISEELDIIMKTNDILKVLAATVNTETYNRCTFIVEKLYERCLKLREELEVLESEDDKNQKGFLDGLGLYSPSIFLFFLRKKYFS